MKKKLFYSTHDITEQPGPNCGSGKEGEKGTKRSGMMMMMMILMTTWQ
jgi:hypothetical protein